MELILHWKENLYIILFLMHCFKLITKILLSFISQDYLLHSFIMWYHQNILNSLFSFINIIIKMPLLLMFIH